MKLDLEIHANDEENNFNVKLEADAIDIADKLFAVASVVQALDFIKDYGTKGTEALMEQVIKAAEILQKAENGGALDEFRGLRVERIDVDDSEGVAN